MPLQQTSHLHKRTSSYMQNLPSPNKYTTHTNRMHPIHLPKEIHNIIFKKRRPSKYNILHFRWQFPTQHTFHLPKGNSVLFQNIVTLRKQKGSTAPKHIVIHWKVPPIIIIIIIIIITKNFYPFLFIYLLTYLSILFFIYFY